MKTPSAPESINTVLSKVVEPNLTYAGRISLASLVGFTDEIVR
jgi:hypothetical protein